jgi:hypothetical protein
MMIVIYISLLVLLALILVFYYKFHQKNKDVDTQLKDLTEKLKKDNTELKDFQQFVINGFQHISKEMGLDKPDDSDIPVPVQEESDPMAVNDDLSNALKEKINNLNTTEKNAPLHEGGEDGAERGEDGAERGEDGAEGGEDGAEGGGEDGAEGGEDGAESGGEDGAEGGGEDGAEGGGEDGAESGGEDGAESGGEDGAESGGEDGAESGGEYKSPLDNLDLENLTLKELQTIARDNNLAIKGPKKNIIERIKSIN